MAWHALPWTGIRCRLTVLAAIAACGGALVPVRLPIQCLAVEERDGRVEVVDCSGRRYMSASWAIGHPSAASSALGGLVGPGVSAAQDGHSASQSGDRSAHSSSGHHSLRLRSRKEEDDEVDRPEAFTDSWWILVGCCTACILCAAMAAGLTLGLTSLEEFEMRVLCNQLVEEVEPTAEHEIREVAQRKLLRDQRCARRILPLISGHYFGSSEESPFHRFDPSNEHFLLVTLLLANATANEALPIFLDRIVPSWAAVLVSVTVVLFLGEIIPSAVFTGPQQLALAASLTPLVRAARQVLAPIVWPISLCLDKCLGHTEDGYSRAQIKALIRTLRAGDSALELDEANMIHGVLEMHHKTAQDIAQPVWKAKMLPHDAILTHEVIEQILHWGHSRLFVYRREAGNDWRKDNIVNVVLVKKLLGVDLDAGRTVESVVQALKRPVVLSPDDNLLNTLNKFQDGTCHLAIISSDPEAVLGAWMAQEPIPEAARPRMFCSLEDVIEELLKEEIYDEEDKELGLHHRISAASNRSATLRAAKRTPRSEGELTMRVSRRRPMAHLEVPRSTPSARSSASNDLRAGLLSPVSPRA